MKCISSYIATGSLQIKATQHYIIVSNEIQTKRLEIEDRTIITKHFSVSILIENNLVVDISNDSLHLIIKKYLWFDFFFQFSLLLFFFVLLKTWKGIL